ncbi:MAG TPA: hypothetical protein VFQ43_18340 [Nitrososphaera sp.]|nr:hypothetical protein [Nitrososphaera sp.]
MNRMVNSSTIVLIVVAVFFLAPVEAQRAKRPNQRGKNDSASVQAVLWHEPSDIMTRDLLYGQGGKEHEPKGNFKFIEEDTGGSNPKFNIKDEQGARWKVKLGVEAQPETVATRLLWAVGYFTDEDYYLSALHVEGMKKLQRGQNLISAEGTTQGARLERHIKDRKKIGSWSWFENPFVGTRELNGLKVMMALINNADLKKENNSIYGERGFEHRYVVSDLGASFGKTGNILTRSIGNLKDYAESKFTRTIRPGYVDFVMRTRPPFLFFFRVLYYFDRARMEKIVQHIPRDDARWMGQLLARLSNKQIQDAFRAGGYSPHEVAGFSQKLCERIAELNNL